jgi:protein-S-isoprenylcysteine O-methyltransferase Ste14
MATGVLSLIGVYLSVLVLHVILPGRWVEGYVFDPAGRRLRYRLNGLLVFVVVVAGWSALAASGWLPWDFFYLHRVSMLVTAFLIGIVFSLAIVLPGPRTGKSWLAELYLGRFENPQWGAGRVDAKMFLYLVGAVMLELLVLSFAAHHYLAYPSDPSPGVRLYAALFSFFLVEYLFFERVHLYTYDFVAERVGLKLGWGCLVFYPFFYCVGLWYAADLPNPHSSSILLFGAASSFFAGWVLARGANLQKYLFKTQPQRTSFGPLSQNALSDGERRVLIGGFWGLSRHINYLGELLMATGLALSLGYPGAIWPWLYPIYYLVLLLPRQVADDQRCAEKYGAIWDQYRRAVPARIVPWIY